MKKTFRLFVLMLNPSKTKAMPISSNNKYREDIFDVWGRKTPSYEKHYESEVIKPLADFGVGTNAVSDAKGKILGAAYEVLIMAYFIGLYSKRQKPFGDYADIKDCGQPIQYWGNLDSKKGRKAYPKLREYIFLSLVARTPDIDWIALDKGQRTVSETVNMLMLTMEEYINYGLSVLAEKLKEDEGYFYNKNSFLDIFKGLTRPKQDKAEEEEDAPESLD